MGKSKTYEEFVDKFKPKLTTDDCHTPPLVYDAIKNWVCDQYGLDQEKVLRPFWPGEDYQNSEYPSGYTVIDNPPFSILSKIIEWFLERDIKFFLFAPSLTVLSGKNICMRVNHIVCNAEIVYENGAVVRTAFITNLGNDDIVLQTEPRLGKAIEDAVDKTAEGSKRTLPKYAYPDHVVTAAMLQRYSKYGVDFRVLRSECVRISTLDAQRDAGKSVFGSGLLLSSEATKRKLAAERAAAERAAAKEWPLSEREKAIISRLDKNE